MAQGKNLLSNSITGNFLKVPRSLIEAINLSSNDKIIFFYIYIQPESFTISARHIANKLNLDKNTVNKSISHLISANLLSEKFNNSGH